MVFAIWDGPCQRARKGVQMKFPSPTNYVFWVLVYSVYRLSGGCEALQRFHLVTNRLFGWARRLIGLGHGSKQRRKG